MQATCGDDWKDKAVSWMPGGELDQEISKEMLRKELPRIDTFHERLNILMLDKIKEIIKNTRLVPIESTDNVDSVVNSVDSDKITRGRICVGVNSVTNNFMKTGNTQNNNREEPVNGTNINMGREPQWPTLVLTVVCCR